MAFGFVIRDSSGTTTFDSTEATSLLHKLRTISGTGSETFSDMRGYIAFPTAIASSGVPVNGTWCSHKHDFTVGVDVNDDPYINWTVSSASFFSGTSCGSVTHYMAVWTY